VINRKDEDEDEDEQKKRVREEDVEEGSDDEEDISGDEAELKTKKGGKRPRFDPMVEVQLTAKQRKAKEAEDRLARKASWPYPKP